MDGSTASGGPPETGVLVGRDAELRTLLTACGNASSGRTAVVLISGEPGVGKSRLLSAACAAAAVEHGTRSLRGYALEDGGMPPYFPLARALAPALTPSAVAQVRGLADLFPVLAAAGLARSGTAAAPARLSADAERLRLFESIVGACSLLAEQQPLILALDDLQWAEAATWEAVVYLARALEGVPCLLILALRDEALQDAGGPEARAVAELNRQRLLWRVPLRRLFPAEIAAIAGQVLLGEVAPPLAALIAGRSQGNPFFAEEITRDLAEQGVLVRTARGWDLPDTQREAALHTVPLTLRLAIVQRLDRLPPPARAALAGAAVLGRAFSERLLAATLGWERDHVREALAPARAAGIVTLQEQQDDGWSFVHDTVREAVYTEAGVERRRLHAAAASALTAAAGWSTDFAHLAELAHHWRQADEPEQAANAALAAAERAAALHATAEALTYARAGRGLRERAAAGRPADATLVEARLAHGNAALTAGEYGEAESALQAALDAAQVYGDRLHEGRAWARLGTLFRRREVPDRAAYCLRSALALLDEHGGAEAEVVDTLIDLSGLEGLTLAQYAQAEEHGQRALDLAARLHRPALEANAALALANTRSRAGDPVTVRPLLQSALDRAVAGGDAPLATEICATLANACYWTGELRASRHFAERRLQLAEGAGDVFGLRHAHSWLALLAWSRGDWAEARRLLRLAEPLLARLDSPEPVAFLALVDGMTDYRIGDYPRAHARIGEALALFEQVDSATLVWYAGWLPLTCLALGRTAEARTHLAAQEERVAALPDDALPARSARNLLALAYTALGDRQRGAACERALRPFAGDYHWSPVRRSLAALAALRGDRDTALADLATLEEQARREEMLPDLAAGLIARAALLPLHDRRRTADAQAGLELLHLLGMTLPPEAGPSSPTAAPERRLPAGLTAREVEVLQLVAQGKTNREIANVLVLSERTVINHLSHIFGKTGVDNRAGATDFAHRHGLV